VDFEIGGCSSLASVLNSVQTNRDLSKVKNRIFYKNMWYRNIKLVFTGK